MRCKKLNDTQIEFNGYRFNKDKSSGYYGSSRITDTGERECLHQYVWKYYNGKISKGYEIHHRDFNKENNDIENLIALSMLEHHKIHAQHIREDKKLLKKYQNNMKEKALPKAIEWHKSKLGLEWHKKQGEKLKGKKYNITKVIKKCVVCGKEFQTDKSHENRAKYCSAKCRKATGIDNVERICPICGSKYIYDKYTNKETCSRKCATKLGWQRRKNKKI